VYKKDGGERGNDGESPWRSGGRRAKKSKYMQEAHTSTNRKQALTNADMYWFCCAGPLSPSRRPVCASSAAKRRSPAIRRAGQRALKAARERRFSAVAQLTALKYATSLATSASTVSASESCGREPRAWLRCRSAVLGTGVVVDGDGGGRGRRWSAGEWPS
jgi:hypothetical protein